MRLALDCFEPNCHFVASVIAECPGNLLQPVRKVASARYVLWNEKSHEYLSAEIQSDFSESKRGVALRCIQSLFNFSDLSSPQHIVNRAVYLLEAEQSKPPERRVVDDPLTNG